MKTTGKFTAEDAPGLPGVSGAVPARGAGGRAKRGPLTALAMAMAIVTFQNLIFAQTGAIIPLSAAVNQVGIVAAVRGAVEITNAGQVGRIVESGQPVYLGDEIKTNDQGHLQILLLDETVFTIGPNSAIVIDKFVYDPSTNEGEIKAKVIKGVFRFVTGKIARKKPSQMEVELPVGTIGIRGTIVGGNVQGSRSEILLYGPGEQHNTSHRTGSMVVSNLVNDKIKKERVTRAGYGTIIEGINQAPLRPFQFRAEKITAINNALSPDQGAAPPGIDDQTDESQEQSPTQQAGQDKAGALRPLRDSRFIQRMLRHLGDESDRSAQFGPEGFIRLANELATFDQLRRIPGGQFHYFRGLTPLFNNGAQVGSYTFIFNIDFAARTVGGGNSRIAGAASNLAGGPFRFNLGTRSFADGNGPAIFDYSGVPDSLSCPGCKADVKIALINHDGKIASDALHGVFIKDSTVNDATGGGDAQRLQGPS